MHVVKARALEAKASILTVKAKAMIFSLRILEAKACPQGLHH
jgi:hypothetical protein